MRCHPADTGCTVPSDGSAGSFWLVCPDVSGYGRYDQWERIESLGDNSYDYVEGIDSQPGSFDYDDPRDYEECCDWNDVDIEEGYYDSFQPNVGGGCVSSGDAFGIDTDTVVVASVVCEAKQVDLQISESPGLCGDIGSGSEKTFLEPRDMLDLPDLSSFVDAGLAGTSPASGDTSDSPVSVGMVDSGLRPPVLEFGDKL